MFKCTSPPGRLYWMALVSRLVTTCASRSESPVISSGSEFGKDFHAAFTGQWPDEFHAVICHLGKIETQPFQGFLPGVKPREFQQ